MQRKENEMTKRMNKKKRGEHRRKHLLTKIDHSFQQVSLHALATRFSLLPVMRHRVQANSLLFSKLELEFGWECSGLGL